MPTKEHAPTLYLSVIFTFGLTVESIKELGGALRMFITFLVYSVHGTCGLTSYKTFDIWCSWELWFNVFTKEIWH
jgi:hypothetical protein